MVMHVFNPNTQEAGREILVSELHSDTLFIKKEKEKKNSVKLSPSFKKSESLFLFFLFNFIFSS